MRTAHFFFRFLKSGTPEREPRAEKARFEVPAPKHCEIRARYYDAGAGLVINAAACDRRRRERSLLKSWFWPSDPQGLVLLAIVTGIVLIVAVRAFG